jgi:hypothetical protein
MSAADIQLGGVVSVHTRSDGTPIFRVGHISGGGDIAFFSMARMLEYHASEFVSARELKLAP